MSFGPFSTLYSCQTQHCAWSIATAMTAFHSDGYGGGGTGQALKIGLILLTSDTPFTL